MPRGRRANIGRRTRHASQQQVYSQNLSEEKQNIIRENARLRQRVSTRRSLASYNRLAFQYDPTANYSDDENLDIGPMTTICRYCNTLKFKRETAGLCCASGKVKLDPLLTPPQPLKPEIVTDPETIDPHMTADCDAWNANIKSEFEEKSSELNISEAVEVKEEPESIEDWGLPELTDAWNANIKSEFEEKPSELKISEAFEVKEEPESIEDRRFPELTDAWNANIKSEFEEKPSELNISEAFEVKEEPESIEDRGFPELTDTLNDGTLCAGIDSPLAEIHFDSHAQTETNAKRNIKNKSLKYFEKYECDLCSTKIFKEKSNLVKHIEKCFKRTYSCTICSRHHKCESNLMPRELNVSKKYILTCKLCERIFRADARLYTSEYNRHRDDVTYSCLICEGKFSRQRNIKQYTHTCVICTKQFTTKQSLKYHIKTHGRIPYTCNLCKNIFISKNDSIGHKCKEIFSCETCQKLFTSKYYFDKHTAIQKSCIYFCRICNKKFKNKQTFKNHMLIHEKNDYYNENSLTCTCAICKMRFKFYASLYKHMKTHELANHVDEIDTVDIGGKSPVIVAKDKIIPVKKTYGSRAGTGKFSCEMCGKPFGKQSSLTQHVQLLHSLMIKKEPVK